MSTYEDRLPPCASNSKRDRLDGFVVPLTDEHMCEYVGAYAQRLAWLTGFQGSAGTAVVLPEEAAIFTDGRYTLQVREQVDGRALELSSVPQTSIADWLGRMRREGGADRLRSRGCTRADWVKKATRGARRARAPSWSRSTPIRSTRSGPTGPAPSDARLVVQPDDARRASPRPTSAPRSPTG